MINTLGNTLFPILKVAMVLVCDAKLERKH